MSEIVDQYKQTTEFCDGWYKLCGDVPEIFFDMRSVTTSVDMLMELAEDEYGWVDWYVFENECGSKGLEVRDEDGSLLSSKTIGDVWNLIYMNIKDK
jgi:hypothetical protein